jgi:Ca-activated chloride channel family protein
MGHSGTSLAARFRRGLVGRLFGLPPVLRVVAVGLLVVALARPQTRDRGGRVEVEGIDIVLAMDLSNSMEAADLQPNRLAASKRVVDSFIRRRRSDRIGIVVFGREAFTFAPLTLDYSVLRNMLSDMQLGLLDGSATAIGNALGVSLARLRESDAKSRVVILLTDGDNNAGNVTPKQAARYASAMGVKVFTILMGPEGGEVVAGRDRLGRPIRVRRRYPVNPELLERIAHKTGGKAYRATDRQALEQNFESILNELDKTTRRDVAAVYEDAYRPFVALALGLILLEALLALTRLRQFP